MKVPKIVLESVSGSIAEDWHQHPNGGGWVYKTAYVEESAYLHPTSIVSGDARVYGNAWTISPLYIQGSRHAVTLSSYSAITIGCLTRTIEEWQQEYRKIGVANGYSEAAIEEYAEYIELAARTAARLKQA